MKIAPLLIIDRRSSSLSRRVIRGRIPLRAALNGTARRRGACIEGDATHSEQSDPTGYIVRATESVGLFVFQ